MRAIAVVAAVGCTVAFAASQYRSLAGEYRLGGRTLIDPPPEEAQDTHLHLLLTGDAARDLYDAMKSRPRADPCGEPGVLVKSIGDMQCRRAGQRFECAFAVDLARQRIVAGAVC